ncbi:putative nicotinate phosphoribosyltransferase [Lyophyllum shimeji]|uniref:Nicotinate phosphoribosyltransferase n=1 Tax=Lyophyllum shimeji TaxID=47721 RepID=A0A9P3UQW0_LYOSH|nr:putative nicotinate phosphoribosyltransferase [Lyophyllum shimeji]
MSASSAPAPFSILDTDLYKFTMQQAVREHFPDVQAVYRFTNRDKRFQFSRQAIELFRTAVSQFTDIALTKEEHDWLRTACPYFTPSYLSYLSAYRFKPEQVHVTFIPVSADGLMGNVEVEARGPWVETIMWEVPLMSALSEIYFHSVNTDWTYDGQEEAAYDKCRRLIEGGCAFSDFGSRRRRSYIAHDLVIKGLVRASREVHGPGRLTGTSNAHFAHKYNLNPIGTIAHEWFMGVAALRGYEKTHLLALDLWEQVYHDQVLIALTDTFTTEAFFKDFVLDANRARKWTGLRHDSGDPFEFAPRVKEVYESLGIDPRQKLIVYSDSLNVDKCLRLQNQANELGLEKVAYGIGTHLTNDFRTASSGGKEKSKALNMVIKLTSVNNRPCIKISDDETKNIGDLATIEYVKRLYGLPVTK